MPPLSWASTAVILSSATTTLLLLMNNLISLYQSSNFVLSLSNYSRSETIFFIGTFLLFTAGTGAVDISSVSSVAGSVLRFDMLSSVTLNDPNISSNTSLASGLCHAVLSVYGFYHTVLSYL